LIEKGADVNPESGHTPLNAAVWNDHNEVVKLLLKHKAAVQGSPYAAKTPMHMAAEKGFTRSGEVLLDFQADPYIKDRSGKSPIYYATYNGHYDMVKLLISYGEDVTQMILGTTLLHLAAEKGHVDVVELLIEKGAVLNAHNAQGESPLDVAINHGQKKVANLITETAIDRKKIRN
jgi:ankyrin repeat protein